MLSVQECQIKNKEEEIYKRLLKNGQVVTSYEVNKLLNEFFESNIPGLPYFKPVEIEAYSKSNKTIYNEMFSKINTDLISAYDIYNNQAEYSVVTQNSYDLEIEDINNQIDSLMLQAQILEEYSKKNTFYYPNVITFNNLNFVNTKNLYKNNIPYTTSEIDFNFGTLRNELHSTPDSKIDLTDSVIKITTNGYKATVDNDTTKLVNGIDSDLIQVTLNGDIDGKTPSLIINIQLVKQTEISKVELFGYALHNTSIRLMLSDDGDNFLEKNEIEGSLNNIWRFNKEKVKAVKIIIEKSTFDYEDEDEKLFYFILKNLSLYNDKYAKTSVYTSTVIPFDKPISDIIIYPDEQRPPSTDIAYFVGVEDKNNDVEWKSIKPNALLDLKLLNKKEMILNYFTSEIFGSSKYDDNLKEHSFYLYELPNYTNLNSIDIRVGHSQWLIEKLQYDNIETFKNASTSNYSKENIVAIAPLDSTIMDIKCEDTWNYFVMSQNVICENDTIIENRFITFDIEDEVFDYIVLINGRQIFSKDNKFTFKLKAGENLIQIMMLLGNLDISDISTTKTIKHNFNLLAYCKSIFAGPTMQKVSYNSLSKNISKHSLRYYCILTENDKDKIIVKFDPNYVIKPTDPINFVTYDGYVPEDVKMNNSEYFRVYLKYKNMTQDVKDGITNKDGNENIRCRLMAKLTTSDISVTPSINSIKVVAE